MPSHTRRDHLPPARIPRHEMRLHQPGRNLEIGLGKKLVEFHRRTARPRFAQINLVLFIARVMIFHPHRRKHPRIAHQLGQLRTQVRSMQSRRHQHTDILR
jgi:hypothetical protein